MDNKTKAVLLYKTKCRICGTITDWFFAFKENMKWMNFATAMSDYIRDPRQSACKKCKMKTVQDVVSYSDKA